MSEERPSSIDVQVFDLGLCRYFSELSPQPMVTLDGPNYLVRHVNAAFSQLVSRTAGELVGRPFAEAVPEGPKNRCLELCDRVYATGRSEIIVEQEHAQTSPCYWSYSVWAIRRENEGSVGLIVQITDATEMAIFRRQVTAMNEQLLLSGTRQHELADNAARANQLKNEFLATVSHELRTPLNAILGWAELLGTSALPPADSRRAVEIIRSSARLQVQLIDDLLDVSRITTGKLRLNIRTANLPDIIIAATDSLRLAAEAKAIKIYLNVASPDGQVSGDPDRLQQVALNLISNAIKFTPEGGSVMVGLDRSESHFKITVSDTGIGISAEFLPCVFDRFRQGDAKSTRAYGGLGLGLSIVRELVELHGGAVQVASPGEGLGTTFTVLLPHGKVSSAISETGNAALAQLTPPEPNRATELSGLRLLVVDNDADAREILRIILEGSGALVQTADSAAAALEVISENSFDVLISDIGMPEEDGYSLIAKVRSLSDEEGGNVPAAGLTGYASEEDRIRVLRAGYQIHVPKPVSPDELIAVVVSLSGRRG